MARSPGTKGPLLQPGNGLGVKQEEKIREQLYSRIRDSDAVDEMLVDNTITTTSTSSSTASQYYLSSDLESY